MCNKNQVDGYVKVELDIKKGDMNSPKVSDTEIEEKKYFKKIPTKEKEPCIT